MPNEHNAKMYVSVNIHPLLTLDEWNPNIVLLDD